MSWARIIARIWRGDYHARDRRGVETAVKDTAQALLSRHPACIECGLMMPLGAKGWMHDECKRLLDLAHTDSGVRA